MSVLAAKDIGFKNCRAFESGMRCNKPITTAFIGDLPVIDFSVTLEEPYSEVKEIEIVFDTKKHTKECKPQKSTSKNPWADVIAADCAIDAVQALSDIFGEPKNYRHKVEWHNCNAYSADYNGTTRTLTLRKYNDYINMRQQECQIIEENKRTKQEKLDKQNNLKNLMK